MLKAIKCFIFSNIYVSLCITLLLYKSFVILNLTPNIHQIGLIFFGTLIIYNFQRFYRLSKSNLQNTNERLAWYLKNKRLIYGILVFSILTVGYKIFFINSFQISILLLLALISVLYVIPFFKIKNKTYALRQIPYLKIFVISLVWAALLTIFILPSIKEVNYQVLMYLMERFVFILAITIPFDIRDLNYDKENNIKTIPQLIGIKKAVFLSILFLIISYAINYFLFYESINWLFYSFIFLLEIIIILNTIKKKNELFYSGIVEGIMVLDFFAVLNF
ncbi:MAG: hypothetical protein Kow0079_00830 [Vicingaceae bacterium]